MGRGLLSLNMVCISAMFFNANTINSFYVIVGQIQYITKKGVGKLAYGETKTGMPSSQREWELNACLRGRQLVRVCYSRMILSLLSFLSFVFCLGQPESTLSLSNTYMNKCISVRGIKILSRSFQILELVAYIMYFILFTGCTNLVFVLSNI